MAAKKRTVILGITGSIAAYKGADVARRLQDAGFVVQPVMTSSAREFIGVLTFEAITGRKVPEKELWMTGANQIGHIELLKKADAVVVAPATANMVAKAANGIADDLLSTIVVSANIPVIIAPAMNTDMYLSRSNQENIKRLISRGVRIVDPCVGRLACDVVGIGKLADSEEIAAALVSEVNNATELAGKRVVLTVGGTVEPIDPVRVLTNLSSGITGMAIAEELCRRGAEVTVIKGRTDVDAPRRAKVVSVGTAAELLSECKKHAVKADALIMAAAVADFRPVKLAGEKIKKTDSGDKVTLELVKNPDILAELGKMLGRPLLVGFAAETSGHIESARAKLKSKSAELFVANLVGNKDSGFGLATTTAAIVRQKGPVLDLGNITKEQLAVVLCDEISKLLKKIPTKIPTRILKGKTGRSGGPARPPRGRS